MPICETKSNTAKRRYLQGSIAVMLSYLVLVAASRLMVNRWHPQGWLLYLAALLPTFPILGFAYIIGRYLREERDEYQRDVEVRAMLWGTAVALSLTMFTDFLRAFGWQSSLPPFTEFIVFWMTTGFVRSTYHLMNRTAGDA